MQRSAPNLATSGVGRLPANPSSRLIYAWLTSFRVTIDVTSYRSSAAQPTSTAGTTPQACRWRSQGGGNLGDNAEVRLRCCALPPCPRLRAHVRAGKPVPGEGPPVCFGTLVDTQGNRGRCPLLTPPLKMLNVQELANVPLHSEKDAVCSNLVVIRKISPDSMSAS
jgi:hypothetical protein